MLILCRDLLEVCGGLNMHGSFGVLLLDVALLEEMCHCGVRLDALSSTEESALF